MNDNVNMDLAKTLSAMTSSDVPPVEKLFEGNLSDLLNEVKALYNKYSVIADEQANALALWTLHTYVYDCSEITPYINIWSAVKGSGKSRILEITNVVAFNPKLSHNMSPAVLARSSFGRTILFDEADTALKKKDDMSESLRGILNSGWESGGSYERMVGANANMQPQSFPTFSPKMISGIGDLPDTIADRSIHIRMVRKKKQKVLPRFRKARIYRENESLRNDLTLWSSDPEVRNRIRDAEPELLDDLEDRANDAWEALFAIADMAGPEWSRIARVAALRLSNNRDDNVSNDVRLLIDMKAILEDEHIGRIFSGELANALNQLEESPWANYSRGVGINQSFIASRLKAFDIRPTQIRIGSDTKKGYVYDDKLADVFERYIPETNETTKHSGTAHDYTLTETFTGLPETNTEPETQSTPIVSSVSHVSLNSTTGDLGWGVVEV